MRNKFLIFITLLFFANNYGQENQSIIQTNIAYGSVFKHKNDIAHLITAHPILFQLSYARSSDTITSWRKHMNFPDTGVSFTHQKFGNNIVGNVTGLTYFSNFYLLNRNASNQFNFEVGLGMAYTDSPMTYENNNQNNVLSSDFVFHQYLKWQYRRPHIFNQFGLQAGLTFTHFSNASYKSPNLGINSLFFNIGLNYIDTKPKIVYPNRIKSEKFSEKQPLKYFISAKIGWHEVYEKLGTKPIYSFSAFVAKPFRKFSDLQLGIDYFNSLSEKQYAEFQYIAGYNHADKIYDHQQIGVFAGYIQYFNKLSFDTQVGYYLYNPLKLNMDIYEKIGLNYKLDDKFKLGIGLKIHNFRANYTAFELQYQIK